MTAMNLWLYNQIPETLEAYEIPVEFMSSAELGSVNNFHVNGDETTPEKEAVMNKLWEAIEKKVIHKVNLPQAGSKYNDIYVTTFFM